jgi:hypothetical protein
LYHNFFNAQQKKDAEHPYGVEEGDETSVRLKNTAYGFASAIAGAVTGEGGESGGGLLIDYLKKTGGDMTGIFRANYGFEAGVANTRILETYSEDITDAEGVVTAVEYGVKITGNLKLGGDALYLGGRNILRYDPYKAKATIDASSIDFLSGSVHSTGEWTIGDKESGIFISPTSLQVCGKDVYHKGNANLSTIDWEMQNGTVHKDFTVHGTTSLNGVLSAKYGVQLGDKGNTLLSFSGDDVALGGYLSFLDGFGIRIAGKSVLTREGETIRLGSIGSDLLLGSDDTPKIRLFSGISDIDGDCLMLTPYGKACFPGSLTVRHNYGAELLSSYRVDSNDEGIVIHKNLRLGTADGILITGDKEQVSISTNVVYEADGVQTIIPHKTSFRHRASTSRYAPQDRYSETFLVNTDADFVASNVPIEAVGHIGIDDSYTRLTDGVLYLTEALRLQAVSDGIRHYGNSYFGGTLSSEFFSAGFAGGGWAIQTNRTTGNVTATFDEVVARKKFRAYEFEVKKLSATNGSLWISDSCSGDSVEKIA